MPYYYVEPYYHAMDESLNADISSINSSPILLDNNESGNVTNSIETTSGLVQDHSQQSLFIKPPFPPTINIDDLVTSKPNGDKPSKSSNAFIIYRKVYVKELHSRGVNLQMTQISPMVSESWKQEPEIVKQEYKKLAEAAKKRYKEIWPSKPRRRHQRRQQPQLPMNRPLHSIESSNSIQTYSSNESLSSTPAIELRESWNLISPSYLTLQNSSYGSSSIVDQIYYDPNAASSRPTIANSLNVRNQPMLTPPEENPNSPTSSTLTHLTPPNGQHTSEISLPELTDGISSLNSLQDYHRVMTNWHKDLKRHDIHPYQSFDAARSVPFFTSHLV
ncbi:10300_t:CDS:1 [Dentiscutata erythropus]|uniref:10300_t:CDS:1 n=1 Tax=Dentiscutata erythropus TaxID=1348616 RepID=A0A9N9IFV3_9GLOM|nr:10300_t:CDS:1 [Dentiscutata erythropus]